MKPVESYAVVLKADLEQFRVTLFDQEMGKVRAIFFGTVSPGMVVRVQINAKTPMPYASLAEIIASPMNIARDDIWWFHMLLALIDACVPLGSGIGPLYEQVSWLCLGDVALDKQLQMRYCAKIITTLGLQRVIDQVCTPCMHSLHVTSVDKLKNIALDSECAARLAEWVTGSLEEHIGTSFGAYIRTKDF